MSHKGVTPVIAIVLLLLITISLIGIVYVFFTSEAEALTEGVREETENNLRNTNTKVSIVLVDADVGASIVTVYVRNTGTRSTNINDLLVFLDNSLKDGDWKDQDGADFAGDILVPGVTGVFTITGVGSCTTVKIDTPGQSAAATC